MYSPINNKKNGIIPKTAQNKIPDAIIAPDKNNESKDIFIAIKKTSLFRQKTELRNKKYPVIARKYFDFNPINVHIQTTTCIPYTIAIIPIATGLMFDKSEINGSIVP